MAPIFLLYLAQKLVSTILKFRFHSTKAENLTTLEFLEIEIFLYKSSTLIINLKELHQYLIGKKFI